jgi:hypothetical protein
MKKYLPKTYEENVVKEKKQFGDFMRKRRNAVAKKEAKKKEAEQEKLNEQSLAE